MRYAVAMLTILGLCSTAAAEDLNLKFGTLAPDNTPWSRLLQDFKKEVEAKSGGKVKVKVYLDGKQGDERAMLQKMRFGQLTGGGFSTGGMAAVVPELQILELPFLFDDNAESDYVMDTVLLKELTEAMDKKGLFLFCWAENGWIDFGNAVHPLHTPKDFDGLKMYAQESDVSIETVKAFGAQAQVLAVPEVLSSLQTGLLNAFMSTPIFATGAQWFTQIKFWTDSNHTYQPAAVVFDAKFWQKMPEDMKQTILGMRESLQKSARTNVRGIDEELYRGFKERKIEISTLTPAERAELRKKTASVAEVLIKKGAFPREWYDRVQKALKEYRAKKK
jgi:TRAP-type C4-dicarboxylate transport system substrate-binding protein